MDKQDVIIAGGGEAEHWGMTSLMPWEPCQQNTMTHQRKPQELLIRIEMVLLLQVEAERSYLKKNNMRYQEEQDLCRLTGYSATSDGQDMVSPSGEGAQRCMEIAWDMCGRNYGLHKRPRNKHTSWVITSLMQ